MKVQVLSFPGCPNAEGARQALHRSLAAAGLPPTFEEVDVTAPGAPKHCASADRRRSSFSATQYSLVVFGTEEEARVMVRGPLRPRNDVDTIMINAYPPCLARPPAPCES